MAAPQALIAYGKGRLPLRMDPALAQWRVIAPLDEPPLASPREAFAEACGNPIESAPLNQVIAPQDRVTIVTSDGTRPVPNALLIPWLLEQLPVPEDHVTILLGNGTHRANTPEEIARMFDRDVANRIPILNHDAFDTSRNVCLGHTSTGAPIELDEAYVEADKRIVLGFIEPHLFAGFSGGAKGVAPGVSGIDSIFDLHGFERIAHPCSTWGVLDGNPVRQGILEMAAACPPDFLINVALNKDKEITRIFAGGYCAAHLQGCAHVRAHAMAPVPSAFPIVVTSNSGFPLDQNLYQTVKGMSAATLIAEPGSTIFVAAECGDGIPEHGNFGQMLRDSPSPQDLIPMLLALREPTHDQWGVQAFARILERHAIVIHSSLDPETAQACGMTATDDLQRAVEERAKSLGKGVPIAVLPEGPITVPYIDGSHNAGNG